MKLNLKKIKWFDVTVALVAATIIFTLVTVVCQPSKYNIERYSIANTVSYVKPSTVHIENRGICQGSGVLIAPDLVVTAKHVVEDGKEFIITMDDGRRVNSTKCLVSKDYDIAFIKIVQLEDVSIVQVGKYKKVRVGDGVFVVGSPYGYENFNSVTLGIISAQLRDLGPDYRFGWRVTFQTDAPIHPGNSGGPVFNMEGEVIGIVVAGQGYSGNVSYCIPVDVFDGDVDNIRLLFELDKYMKVEQIPVPEPEWGYDEFEFFVQRYNELE